MLGLRFCVRAFSSCGKRGPLFIAVRGPLTVAASLVAEHRLQTRRLSNCGSRAQLLHGMWDLPRPGLEPVSPALAGRLSTTAPPGKSPDNAFLIQHLHVSVWEYWWQTFWDLEVTTKAQHKTSHFSHLLISVIHVYHLWIIISVQSVSLLSIQLFIHQVMLILFMKISNW